MTDFLLNCGAILSAVTLYSSASVLLNIFLLTPAAVILLVYNEPVKRTKAAIPHNKGQNGLQGEQSTRSGSANSLPMKPFVTSYRGAMMVITCMAILAVDFKIFPRRFAKVETWGTSLMDMGVGSFVFSAGVVSARTALKERITKKASSLADRLITSARHSAPLLLLGLIRLWSVKGLDLAEHVSEYGVHWNFFFTLAFIPPFVAVCHSAFRYIPSYAAQSLVIGAVYEACLDLTQLRTYILTAPRTDLLSKNREGVFSLFGYLAIFLAGQAVGMDILPRELRLHLKSQSTLGRFRSSGLGKLAIWSLSSVALFELTTSYRGLGLLVSRRLANLPYLLWVTAFNCCQLMLFCAIERFCFPDIYKTKGRVAEERELRRATSKLLYAFNRNGLAIFLLANPLTGLVNMTLPTLQMNKAQSMVVLGAYAAVLSGAALALDRFNLSIKL